MSDQQPAAAQPPARPYHTLLAKGEDRKLRILAAAQEQLVRKGWRNTSLAQVAKQAGVSQAGLLHHFESKDQLLHAVLEARDLDDELAVDRGGDILVELGRIAERFERAPDLVGIFAVLLIENLEPTAPLHDRLLMRYRYAIDTVADGIRRGQHAGRFRSDLDPTVKAVEIVAFLNGMETSWLLDPSIPVPSVFSEYVRSLSRQLAPESMC
ncbi:TetR/AcrR family transcriptional regulator [Nocardia goodfellowii]